ncbi:MAG: HD family phosphohydrolase [Chlamydiia bacterium]
MIRVRIFTDQSPTLRVLLLIFFTLCLALFLHVREVHVAPLTQGAPSPRYVVAQIPFDYVDQDAMRAARQEALRGLEQITQVDDKVLRDRRLALEQEVTQTQEWRAEIRDASMPALLTAIAEVQDRLAHLRFADPETADRAASVGLSVGEFIPHGDQPADLPRDTLQQVIDSVPGLSSEERAWLFRAYGTPALSLAEDRSADRALRNAILDRIPPHILHVPAGARIIDQGEQVGSRHVAMMRAMKGSLNQERHLWHFLPLVGSLILAGLAVSLGAIYFIRRQPELVHSAQRLALYFTVVLLTLTLSKVVELLSLAQAPATATLAGELAAYPCVIPFAVILLGVLLSPEVALFTGIFLSVLLSLSLSVDVPRFLLLNIIASLVACLSARSLRRRKDVFIVACKTWVACVPFLWSIQLAHDVWWSRTFAVDLFGTAVALLTTAILVVGLLPLLESVFNLLTDITLMEYMDPNNELLRRLTLEAPGTYQHSLVVGNLAEAAAAAISANGLFCRVATLYHDVGKLIGPHYFTENQQGGVNIHSLLTPTESAQVIVAHVTEGLQLAKQHGLPEAFSDIIQEHHGTTLVYYFFCKQLDLMQGNTHLVQEQSFRYPGPKPRSKESAIIMVADCLEAASRSLEEFSEVTLTELVDRIVHEKAEDGQLDQCNLTFEELGMVKRAMVKTLLVTSHSRIKYPRRLAEV